MTPSRRGPLLAIDTATKTAVIALGDAGGAVLVTDDWTAGFRHGEELLARIAALLEAGRVDRSALGGIVVGTGPGAFTGLRVGLATAKGLAHGLAIPIVGISTGEALLAAVAASTAGGGDRRLALLLPAGPSDRVLVTADAAPELIPGGAEPPLDPNAALVALDLDGRAPAGALELGAVALAGLAAALLRLGGARLAAERPDDLARLVPEYVTLPRGIRTQTGEVAWSRDRR